MKLNVPFHAQQTKYDCGPTALLMALEYLGEKHSREELQDLVDSDKSGVTWTIGLATAAATLRFRTELFTTCLGFNPNNYALDYYQKVTDGADKSQQKVERLKHDAVRLGVNLQEKSLSLEQVLEKINENCIPIILIDWGTITGKNKFAGHFVPIVGYNHGAVYVHNQEFGAPQPFLPITCPLFDAARKAAGTDEDIVFIYRK